MRRKNIANLPRLEKYMDEAGLDALVLRSGQNFTYLSGVVYPGTLARHMDLTDSTRPVVLVWPRKGKPKIFIAHGTSDQTMPIDLTARRFSAELKADGYDVTYREYDGGHRTPPEIVRDAFSWLVGAAPKPLA